MNAKKMFEELGYKYYEDDGFNCYKKEKRKLIEPDYISFNRLEREIFISNNSKSSNGEIIDMKLLEAINKQIEELKWERRIENQWKETQDIWFKYIWGNYRINTNCKICLLYLYEIYVGGKE